MSDQVRFTQEFVRTINTKMRTEDAAFAGTARRDKATAFTFAGRFCGLVALIHLLIRVCRAVLSQARVWHGPWINDRIASHFARWPMLASMIS